MNDTTKLEARPEVAAFVGAVRARLSDLSDEVREELVGGLEADLAELVADGGSVDGLGDPRAYADELRAAAGLGERPGAGVRALRRPSREAVAELLDNAHGRWDDLVARPGVAAVWSFLVAMRPLWWFFRAWLAVQLVDMLSEHVVPAGGYATPVPTLYGVWPGLLALAVAVVVSVQIGRGRWWPGSALRRSVAARLLLLALNAFAVLVTPVVLGQFPASGTLDVGEIMRQAYGPPVAGLMNRGEFVENVFAYDAQGRPLTGVQLFDQDGRPLAVNNGATDDWDDAGRGTVQYPWLSGADATAVWNVFPLPTRTQDGYDGSWHAQAWSSTRPPQLPAAPLVAVPSVSLPSGAPSAAAGVAPGPEPAGKR